MTFRRIAALAQALTMTTLLLPGPGALGPGSASAALRAPDPGSDATTVFDATGRGIGCQARSARFRGPTSPSDPPWPPGAEPSPSPPPEPSSSPGTEPSEEPSAAASPSPSLSAPSSPAEGTNGAAAFLQAELPAGSPPPEAAPPGGPDAGDADIAPDVPSRRDRDRSAYVRGIDVSHHNDDIDYDKVRRAGYDFVFAKATQDNDFIDPMFLTNMARARAAGLSAGGYHFFDYSLDGRVQADHFVDRLDLAGAVDDALPPVVDVECWAPIGSSIHAVSAARLRDFVARVYERTGRLPIIYTSVFMWREVMGNAEGFEDQPLWAACWGCQEPPSIAPGWDGWAFWQTGIDRIRGVKRLDGNLFSGSVEDLYAMRLRPLTLAAGAPATASQDVDVDLGGRDATHVRTSPDGATWSRWLPIRGTPSASIGETEGSHTVYVQLRHGSGRSSPVYADSIELDRSGPQLTVPTARLRLGPLGATGPAGAADPTGAADPSKDADPSSDAADPSKDADPAASPGTDPAAGAAAGIPVEVAWQASDEPAGLGDASVEVACGDAGPQRSAAPGAADPGVVASWTAAASLGPGADCAISVEATDGAGNTSRATSPEYATTVHAVADGGATGATVEGEQVGVIARRGPDGGRADIAIDGEQVGSVELYAPEALGPEVVFVAELPPGQARTISVMPTSEADPAAGGEPARVEGFVTLTGG